MTTKKTAPKKVGANQKSRFIEAEKDLKKLQAEIAPFARKHKFIQPSFGEQWIDTYTLSSIAE